jgi:hypothetical protein
MFDDISTVFDDLDPDELIPASQLQRYARDEKVGLVSKVKTLYSRLVRTEERYDALTERLRHLQGLYARASTGHGNADSFNSMRNFHQGFQSLITELFDSEASAVRVDGGGLIIGTLGSGAREKASLCPGVLSKGICLLETVEEHESGQRCPGSTRLAR